jgi:malonyl-CoA O-methyltransferase
MFDKKEVRRAFDRAAQTYDAHAVVQREIAGRLAERLDLVSLSPRRILDVGCGTGQNLALLRARYPNAEMIGLDLAFPMLQVVRGSSSVLRKLAGLWARPASHQVCADMERLPLAGNCVQMAWSSLAFQWATELPVVLSECHRVIAPGGLLIFATLGPDTLKELRQAFAQVDGGTHVSHFLDMHDIGDMLVHAGFQHPVMEMEMLTLTYADIKSLLRDLKGIGAHNAAADRARGMMGKAAWHKLEQAYETFRKEGRLPATYEVIYGHAWVGDKTRLEDGRQVIQWKIEKRRAGL